MNTVSSSTGRFRRLAALLVFAACAAADPLSNLEEYEGFEGSSKDVDVHSGRGLLQAVAAKRDEGLTEAARGWKAGAHTPQLFSAQRERVFVYYYE
jgi:hypothetical protein